LTDAERRDIGSRLENWGRLYHRHDGAHQPRERRTFDQDDAQLVDRCMSVLPMLQRSLLWWCYVHRETPDQVCRRLGIAHRPALHFIESFRLAQTAIEQRADAATLPQER
jgi:hypothetical protein